MIFLQISAGVLNLNQTWWITGEGRVRHPGFVYGDTRLVGWNGSAVDLLVKMLYPAAEDQVVFNGRITSRVVLHLRVTRD
jgi:hypothetical protein